MLTNTTIDITVNKADRYIQKVLSGEVNHGKYIGRLVEMIIADRNKESRWVYKPEIADKFIGFIEKIKFTEGEKQGQLINLEDWQAFLISQIFGWVDKDDPAKRRFVEVTLEIPRKNGKTTLAAVKIGRAHV